MCKNPTISAVSTSNVSAAPETFESYDTRHIGIKSEPKTVMTKLECEGDQCKCGICEQSLVTSSALRTQYMADMNGIVEDEDAEQTLSAHAAKNEAGEQNPSPASTASTYDSDPLAPGPEVKCEECGKIFPSEHVLGMHEKRAHWKTRPLHCGTCEKTFRLGEESELEAHRRIHLNQNRFECTACGGKFVSATILHRHACSARTRERSKKRRRKKKDKGKECT
jgi:hypothetical protein